MEEKNIESVLKLEHCVFDEITFRRNGFKTDNEAEFEFAVNIANRDDHEYIVMILVKGEKKDEYELELRLSGYFSVDERVEEKEEESLIKYNAVAIMLPYMRSEISLLTAQPETESEVLPIINVFKAME